MEEAWNVVSDFLVSPSCAINGCPSTSPKCLKEEGLGKITLNYPCRACDKNCVPHVKKMHCSICRDIYCSLKCVSPACSLKIFIGAEPDCFALTAEVELEGAQSAL